MWEPDNAYRGHELISGAHADVHFDGRTVKS